jgi:LysR family transcriptional regulator, transcriptional activator of nhaA
MSLNYSHLRYFWAVAHDGNLTRTASRLNLSQSALSAQIRTLEARLGHSLFERRGRRLELTEAGRIVLDHADTIFRTGDDLLSSLSQADRARRVLRVGALATLSRNFQLDFLRPLLGRSDLELVLRSGGGRELLNALRSHDLDVVLTNKAPLQDALSPYIVHRLAEQRVSLIGAPSRLAPSRSLADLLRLHPLICPTLDSSIRSGFDAIAARVGVRPQFAAEVDDMAMMRLLVREDVGLGVLPPIVVKDELASGLLIEADLLPGLTETFYAVTVDRRFPQPDIMVLLNYASSN